MSTLTLALLFACKGGDDTPADDTGVQTDDSGITDDSGVDTDDTGDTQDPGFDIDIEGEWVSTDGPMHLITRWMWSIANDDYTLVEVDNGAGRVIALDEDEQWARFDWLTDDDQRLWVCQSAKNAASQEEAEAGYADNQDLDTGCAKGPWTGLSEELEIAGSWVDEAGGTHEIDPWSWVSGEYSWRVAELDTEYRYLIAENGSDNPDGAGLWSRFEWTEYDQAWYVCQIGDAEKDKQAAIASGPADPGDLSAGCGGAAWLRIYEPIGIRGEWVDSWGGFHEIDESSWVSGDYDFAISQYLNESNDEGWAIAQNGAANPYNPEKWSRFQWTESEDQVYFCQIVYDADTEEDALSAEPAVPDELETGCDGFSWTAMDPALEIRGTWTDSWGGTQSIDESTWSDNFGNLFHIASYDNDSDFLIAQNDAGNTYFAEKWSRFQWTWEGEDLYYCQAAYDAETQEDAEAASADAEDLSMGCAGFSWTQLL